MGSMSAPRPGISGVGASQGGEGVKVFEGAAGFWQVFCLLIAFGRIGSMCPVKVW